MNMISQNRLMTETEKMGCRIGSQWGKPCRRFPIRISPMTCQIMFIQNISCISMGIWGIAR